MEVKVGLRVVRGPDWKWGNQDGGEGHLGTVVEVKAEETPSEGHASARAVMVQWDNGSRCNYRCGIQGQYDLRVFDNGPIGVIHPHIICDSCRDNKIKGMRWKCTNCFDFDLCTQCYMSGKHSVEHDFHRQDTGDTPKVKVPPRGSSKRLSSRGLFKNAQVVRGHDWLWGDQDGGTGNVGQVTDVKGWENDTFRSVAEVQWKEAKKKNVYRVGHKGKVDLKATVAGDGGCYYPDHLPVLGKPYEAPPPSEDKDFSSGDVIRISLEPEVFKALQQGHGGWNEEMLEILGQVGTVHCVLDSGDLRVRYSGNRVWTVNSAAVTRVKQFAVNDVVKVMDDIAAVHDLQADHGGWVDDMALSLGQAGRVINVFPSGDIRVSVNGRNWTYNPACLTPAPGENPPPAAPEAADIEPEDMALHLKLLSLLENPAVVVASAAHGDVDTLRQFLTKHPSEVNTKAAGKTALHCSAVAGNMAVLKCLMEFKPNLEVEDEDGDKPLHLCAFGDEDEAAQLLISNGANVNCTNKKGATPLLIAALKGSVSVLKLLLQQPGIDIRLQDEDGHTPLHIAVLAQRNECVSLLLESKADPELVNFRLFTPIHEAGRIGFLPAMEQFIEHRPDLVNLKKDDGYTALHLSALNDHVDVVTTLVECDQCNIDAPNQDQQTPLHLAVHQGHFRVIERLVGFGANLNAQDKDGDTPLHIALVRETVDSLTDTPQLQKVRESFKLDGKEPTHQSATLACFLVQEGADIYIVNHKGNTPLQMCSPDIATLVTTFVDHRGSFHGSLRLSRSSPDLPLPSEAPVASGGAAVVNPSASKPGKGGSQGAPPQPQKVSPATMARTTPSKPVTEPVAVVSEPVQLPPRSHSTVSAMEECYVCEAEVTVRLKPCGHASLCEVCSKRAKKCPLCRAPIQSVEEIVILCSMCEEAPRTVTMLPCKHQFCSPCGRRMKVCFECKTAITSKDGLSPEPAPAPAVTPTQSVPLVCSICCDNPRDTALSCGHQYCHRCSQRFDHCPVCRKFVQNRIRLFDQ